MCSSIDPITGRDIHDRCSQVHLDDGKPDGLFRIGTRPEVVSRDAVKPSLPQAAGHGRRRSRRLRPHTRRYHMLERLYYLLADDAGGPRWWPISRPRHRIRNLHALRARIRLQQFPPARRASARTVSGASSAGSGTATWACLRRQRWAWGWQLYAAWRFPRSPRARLLAAITAGVVFIFHMPDPPREFARPSPRRRGLDGGCAQGAHERDRATPPAAPPAARPMNRLDDRRARALAPRSTIFVHRSGHPGRAATPTNRSPIGWR